MSFIILLQIMFYSFLIGFSGAIIPGPVLTAVIKETPQRGWTAGPLVVLGHSFTELGLLIGLVFGLDSVLQAPIAVIFVSIIGGILLCILAGLMLIDVFVKKVSITEQLTKRAIEGLRKQYRPIFDGILLSISNPFWIVWWATIGIGLIYTNLPPLSVLPIDFGLLGLTFFYIGHIISDLSWYTFISGMIHSGKRWITDKVYKGILVCCACFLIYLGVTFIINGITLI
ncbi:MAG: LysE family transporter [Candidatus Helarchaeota archaeon]